MDDAPFVCRFDALGDLAEERQGLIECERLPGDALGERLAFDELHDQKMGAVVLFEAIKRGDVGMAEGGEESRFTLETGMTLGVLTTDRQDFESDFPTQLGITGTENFSG